MKRKNATGRHLNQIQFILENPKTVITISDDRNESGNILFKVEGSAGFLEITDAELRNDKNLKRPYRFNEITGKRYFLVEEDVWGIMLDGHAIITGKTAMQKYYKENRGE